MPGIAFSQKHFTVEEWQQRLKVSPKKNIEFFSELGLNSVDTSYSKTFIDFVLYTNLNKYQREVGIIGFYKEDSNDTISSFSIGYSSYKRGELKKWKKEIRSDKDYRLIARDQGRWEYLNEVKNVRCQLNRKKYKGIKVEGIVFLPKYLDPNP